MAAHPYGKEYHAKAAVILKSSDSVVLDSPDILVLCQNGKDHPLLLARIAELLAAEKYPSYNTSGPIFPEF